MQFWEEYCSASQMSVELLGILLKETNTAYRENNLYQLCTCRCQRLNKHAGSCSFKCPQNVCRRNSGLPSAKSLVRASPQTPEVERFGRGLNLSTLKREKEDTLPKANAATCNVSRKIAKWSCSRAPTAAIFGAIWARKKCIILMTPVKKKRKSSPRPLETRNNSESKTKSKEFNEQV